MPDMSKGLNMKTKEQIKARLEQESAARDALVQLFIKTTDVSIAESFQKTALHHHSVAKVLEWVLKEEKHD